MAPTLDPKAVFSNLFAGYFKLPLAQKLLFPFLLVFQSQR